LKVEVSADFYDHGRKGVSMTSFRAIATCRTVIWSLGANARLYVQITLPWILVVGLAELGVRAFYASYLGKEALLMTDAQWLGLLGMTYLVATGVIVSVLTSLSFWVSAIPFVVLVVLNVLAISSVAVNRTRLLFLSEPVKGPFCLRLDKAVGRYATRLVLLQICVLSICVASIHPIAFAPQVLRFLGSFSFLLCLAVLWALLAISVVRSSLWVTAAALTRHDYRLRDAWADTRGYQFKLLGFAVLMLFLNQLIGLAFEWMSITSAALVGRGALFNLLAVQGFAFKWLMIIAIVETSVILYGIFADRQKF